MADAKQVKVRRASQAKPMSPEDVEKFKKLWNEAPMGKLEDGRITLELQPQWIPIDQNEKFIGVPVWVRGRDWGYPDGQYHYTWAYWDGSGWRDNGTAKSPLNYLTDYFVGVR